MKNKWEMGNPELDQISLKNLLGTDYENYENLEFLKLQIQL